LNTPTSSALIAQLRTGQSEAFVALYRAEGPVVYGYLLRLTRRKDVAADLFQNVWLKLVSHAQGLASDTRIRAWLLTVAHNEVRSHQRWCRWDLSRVVLFARSATFDAVAPSDERLDVQRALDRLGETDRETLLLEAVDDLTPDDACVVLGVTPAAWRKRLSRARSRLEALLNQSPIQPLERNPS
jgi:RNA polymerase sigma-70 factor (ECF subfamily)